MKKPTITKVHVKCSNAELSGELLQAVAIIIALYPQVLVNYNADILYDGKIELYFSSGVSIIMKDEILKGVQANLRLDRVLTKIVNNNMSDSSGGIKFSWVVSPESIELINLVIKQDYIDNHPTGDVNAIAKQIRDSIMVIYSKAMDY